VGFLFQKAVELPNFSAKLNRFLVLTGIKEGAADTVLPFVLVLPPRKLKVEEYK
jgi:hypothetical protein